MKLKLIVLKDEYYKLVNDPEQLISKNGNDRACMLTVKLKFKGDNYKFAIPWRSNVSSDPLLDKVIYLLPNTSKTKKEKRACLDFRKMTPITSKCNKLIRNYRLFRVNDLQTAEFIEKNINEIVVSAKRYLHNREKGKKLPNSVNIENAIKTLKKNGY